MEKMEAAASVTDILSKLMHPNLNDQEKHVLVKALNGVLIEQLDDDQSVMGPYTHKILVVIEPMLIDEDDNTRVEGRKVISNLSKAVGLSHMIAALRPDIDNIDEDVRTMTAKAFSVVASALGIRAVLHFLKGVCQSKRSWETRQTGMKIVQEIALLMGTEVVPHLRSLVEIIIEHGLNDEKEEIRSIADLSLDALAEAAGPDGVDIIMEIKGCLDL